jgi:Na+-driven multidrug efflux pump
LSFLALVAIVNIFGTDVLAAYSVGARINSLATMPAMVFGNALSIFVGQNIGAQKMYRTYKGFRAAFIMTTGVAVFIGFIVLVFGKVLMRLFIPDEQVIQEGYNYLSIIGSFYIVFNAMFVVAGFLRGAGDTFIPMLVNILTLWVLRIPIAYFLSDKIGPAGIWWSFPVSWGGAVILYYSRYLTGKWKMKSVIKAKEEDQNTNEDR